LIRLSNNEKAREIARRALRGLKGFVTALKVKYEDIEMGFDFDAEPGLADNGDLEHDLQDLFQVAGEAAESAGTALVIFIDELQYVEEEQLAALITALHRVSQRQLPVVLVGAGLPQLAGRMGNAKSYAERLFEFAELGPLEPADATLAIANPARDEGVEYEDAAMACIISETQCYAYFLQEWGKHCWDIADESPITGEDAAAATKLAIAALDASFFRVRFDRLTPAEKKYLRAMSVLGAGPHRSGKIADELNRHVRSVAPIRNNLINKGMVWSPNHGDTAFTVPLFDEYKVRVMPGDDWRE